MSIKHDVVSLLDTCFCFSSPTENSWPKNKKWKFKQSYYFWCPGTLCFSTQHLSSLFHERHIICGRWESSAILTLQTQPVDNTHVRDCVLLHSSSWSWTSPPAHPPPSTSQHLYLCLLEIPSKSVKNASMRKGATWPCPPSLQAIQKPAQKVRRNVPMPDGTTQCTREAAMLNKAASTTTPPLPNPSASPTSPKPMK